MTTKTTTGSMTMTEDEIALWLITKGTMEDKPVMALAADRILTLRAEREALEQDNHRWKMECENFWRDREKDLTAERDRLKALVVSQGAQMQRQSEAAEAERDRLRDALEYILAECTLSDNTMPSVGAIKYAARAALKGETP